MRERTSAPTVRSASRALVMAALVGACAIITTACLPKPAPVKSLLYAGCNMGLPGTTTTTVVRVYDLSYRGTANGNASNRVGVVGDSITVQVMGTGGGATLIGTDYLLNIQARA